MANEELVNIPVPRKYLTAVYGLIASLDGGAPSSNARANDQRSNENRANATDDAALDEWTSSRIRRMLDESPPAMRDILNELANHAGDWLTTGDLAKAIRANKEADWQTVAGTLGAFARRVKNRYGLESRPFVSRWDPEARESKHRMPEEIGKRLLELLAAA